ncbi:putative Mannose-1-phosphate guanyltransferase [Magnetospirillum sp. XM-1]|uniref:phosphocholine cytidylyltransferase family protein n=1 Tax=Magnetospirillum sp. XM-1 TaxID=1663591 RepID=UPI00073DD21E|nr:phosphocholine cytidylyltransferase family protein [Magnetospirillum sp. XM-1]CUW37965.1 putative Mannose-1-phosphate guanyltransferase [Magnetospirillum sp. XM-1]
MLRAVILAAGRGLRLGSPLGDQPKIMLSFGGKTLLKRHLAMLQGFGVNEVVIATGFHAGIIEQALAGHPGIRTISNPDFERGSVVTLHRLGPALTAGGDVLVMDADVLCHPDMVRPLLEPGDDIRFLLDRDFEPGDEPVKLLLDNGKPVEFRKKVDPVRHDTVGESVGFFRFSATMAGRLAKRAAEYVAAGRLDEPYEEVIRDLVLAGTGRQTASDITGLPWVEIDFPADVERAATDILPRLPN